MFVTLCHSISNPANLGFSVNRMSTLLSLNYALDDLSAHRLTVTQETTSSIQLQDYYQTTHFGMRFSDWVQLFLFFFVLAIIFVPLGGFIAKVYMGEHTFLSPVLIPIETWILSASGVKMDEEMDWKQFSVALIVFSIICIVVVFLLQEVQQFLPLNPAGMGSVRWDLSLNTAVSFVTNTNWQAYAGEKTVSYLTQMIGLCVQNFVSAAVGLAILIAFIYGFSRRSSTTIGNFWVLIVRSVMILLPISIIIAILLVSQGTVQTFNGPIMYLYWIQ